MSTGLEKLQLFLWLKVLLLAMVLVKCSAKEQEGKKHLFALSTEDIRFATSRCLNDSQITSSILKMKWFQMIFPDTNKTHCFVKCFLSRLGLIDLETKGIDVKKLYTVWHSVNQYFNETCLNDVESSKDLDGTCLSYYKAWTLLWDHCSPLMKYIFFNNSKIRSKAFGETATEFCYSFTYKNNDRKQIRPRSRFTPSILALYKLNLACVFRQFHYFDAYGRIDSFEIQQSFDEARLLTPNNTAAVRICSYRAYSLLNKGLYEVAFELNKCLTEESADFFQVYLMRNTLTRYY